MRDYTKEYREESIDFSELNQKLEVSPAIRVVTTEYRGYEEGFFRCPHCSANLGYFHEHWESTRSYQNNALYLLGLVMICPECKREVRFEARPSDHPYR